MDNSEKTLPEELKPPTPKPKNDLNISVLATEEDPSANIEDKKILPSKDKVLSKVDSHQISEPKSWAIDEKDFLPSQGKAPNHTSSFIKRLPIDKTVIGLHIDSGKFFMR